MTKTKAKTKTKTKTKTKAYTKTKTKTKKKTKTKTILAIVNLQYRSGLNFYLDMLHIKPNNSKACHAFFYDVITLKNK